LPERGHPAGKRRVSGVDGFIKFQVDSIDEHLRALCDPSRAVFPRSDGKFDFKFLLKYDK
jgi:hypothetical protein